MTDTTYLEIRGGEAGAARVVELTGSAIRIGRGPVCEVRLGDPDLAEVQCLLRRRGEDWHVQPIGPVGLVAIESEFVDHLRPLPPDVPLRVGSYCLAIRAGSGGRPREAADADARAVGSPDPVPSRVGEGDRPEGRSRATGTTTHPERSIHRGGRDELRQRWLHARQEEKRWEARWRAAAEGLRARVTPAVPRGTAARSDRPDVAYRPALGGPGATDRPEFGLRRTPPPSTSAPTIGVTDPPGREVPRRSPPRPDEVGFEAGPTTVGVETGTPIEPRPMPDAAQAPGASPVLREDGPPPSTGLRIIDAQARVVVAPGREAGPRPAGRSEVRRDDEPSACAGEPFDGGTGTFSVGDTAAISWHLVEDGEPQGPSASAREDRAGGGAIATSTPALTSPGKRGEFPDATTIFAAQGRRAVAPPSRPAAVRRQKGRRPQPTDPREPARWTLPIWVVLPPSVVGAGAVLAVGLMLAAGWARDNLSVGRAVRAALLAEGAKPVFLDPDERVETRWWKTTPRHLAFRAAAIERSPEMSARVDETRDILDAARRAGPLEPSIRYVFAQGDPGAGSPAPAPVGLSRDIASLALTGRILKRAGKDGPSLSAYRSAIELAAGAAPSHLDPPAFDDDPQVRRFRLPHEGLVTGVIRDMMEAGDWGFADWSPALPPRAVVRLSAARLLHERGSPDAASAFAMVIGDDVATPPEPGPAAEHLCAQAEALAMAARREEAAARYREAIGRSDDDVMRRRCRLALAAILAPTGEPRERAELLEAARGGGPVDEVAKRALEAKEYAGLK